MLHRTTHYWGWLVCPLADRNRENPTCREPRLLRPVSVPLVIRRRVFPPMRPAFLVFGRPKFRLFPLPEAFFDLQWPSASEQATALRFYQLASSHPVRGFCR
jgi:hypothetical protein